MSRGRPAAVIAATACALLGIFLATQGMQRRGNAHASASQIEATLMSPFCPGLSLTKCPSQQSTILRQRIREQVNAGLPRDRILDELRAEYGASIMAEPPNEGVGLAAWLAPALALMVASAAILRAGLRINNAPEDESTVPRAAQDVAALQEELRSRGAWRTL